MASQSRAASLPAVRWPELDLFRGLACMAMIANHAGVRWLGDPAPDSINGALMFAGGLAPVLFFTVTGIGRGLQSRGQSRHRPMVSTLQKAMVLFLADAALWLAPGRLAGMDFLGFIGLSVVLLDGVDRSSRPRRAAVAALLAVVGVRFVVSRVLALPMDGGPLTAVTHWVLGDVGVFGFSYPLGPWLAFPLLGYVLGSFAAEHEDLVTRHGRVTAWCALSLSVSGYAACLALTMRGFAAFRWGTMSFAYFVLSGAAIATAIAVVLAAPRALDIRWQERLALPGASSLIVVPIHYALVHLVHLAMLPMDRGVFPLLVLGCTIVSFGTARALEARALELVRSARSAATLEAFCFGMTVLLLVPLALGIEGASRLMIMVAAQLAACVLFVAVAGRRVGASTQVVPEAAASSR